MSLIKIFEERNTFEVFKRILPDHWSLDLPYSNMYAFFNTVGQEFLLLYQLGKFVATARYLGMPIQFPNAEPIDITADTEKINALQIGGITLEELGQLLNLDIYKEINEREQSYRERLLGSVQQFFGGGTKPSIIGALEFATKRFDGYGANQDGYTADIIEPFSPIFTFGTNSTPPTGYGGNYFYFGTNENIPANNKAIYDLFGLPNDWSRFGIASQLDYDPSILHFIVRFLMDTNIGNGYYYATYNFQGDTGTQPSDFTVNNEDSNTHFIIAAEIDDHKEVIELFDNNASGYVEVEQAFATQQSAGFVGFWFRFNEEVKTKYIALTGASTDAVRIRIIGNVFTYFYNGGANFVQFTLESKHWYHCRIQFDTVTDTASIWIDGNLEIDDLPFMYGQTYITRFHFFTTSGDSAPDFYWWIDALDYSWDDNYVSNRSRIAEMSDYEYWGGLAVNTLSISGFNEYYKSLNRFATYIENYKFLFNIILTLKLAGVSFELQIEPDY
jgi:hypothetical protein